METTTRMGSRSSSRHGPAVQFSGRVRKWQKTWTKSGTSDKLQVLKWLPLSGDREEEQEELPAREYRYLPVDVVESQAKVDQKAPQEEAIAALEANVQSKDAEVVMIDPPEMRQAEAEVPASVPQDEGGAVSERDILPQAQADTEGEENGALGQVEDQEVGGQRGVHEAQVQVVSREETRNDVGERGTLETTGDDAADLPDKPASEPQTDGAEEGATGTDKAASDVDRKGQAAAVDNRQGLERQLTEVEGDAVVEGEVTRSQEHVGQERLGLTEVDQQESADKQRTEEGETGSGQEKLEESREEARPSAENVNEHQEPTNKPAEGDTQTMKDPLPE